MFLSQLICFFFNSTFWNLNISGIILVNRAPDPELGSKKFGYFVFEFVINIYNNCSFCIFLGKLPEFPCGAVRSAGQSAEVTQDLCILSQDELLFSLSPCGQVRGLVSGQRSALWKHFPLLLTGMCPRWKMLCPGVSGCGGQLTGGIRAQLRASQQRGVWCKNVWAESERVSPPSPEVQSRPVAAAGLCLLVLSGFQGCFQD